MRPIRNPWLILLLPLLLSCASDDKPCDPSQPCGETYSLQITVRDSDGSPVEGIEVFGMSVPDTPFGPLERRSIFTCLTTAPIRAQNRASRRLWPSPLDSLNPGTGIRTGI